MVYAIIIISLLSSHSAKRVVIDVYWVSTKLDCGAVVGELEKTVLMCLIYYLTLRFSRATLEHHYLSHCQPIAWRRPPQTGTIYFCPMQFSSMSCQQTSQFYLPSNFLSSLTSRICHWSQLCCYLSPTIVFSSGKGCRPSPFLDFNLFYNILNFSVVSDPFASFSICLGNSWHTSFHAYLRCSKLLLYLHHMS